MRVLGRPLPKIRSSGERRFLRFPYLFIADRLFDNFEERAGRTKVLGLLLRHFPRKLNEEPGCERSVLRESRNLEGLKIAQRVLSNKASPRRGPIGRLSCLRQ